MFFTLAKLPPLHITLQNTHISCLTFLIFRRTRQKKRRIVFQLPFEWQIHSQYKIYHNFNAIADWHGKCDGIVGEWSSVCNELNFPIENQLTFKTIQFDSVMIDINWNNKLNRWQIRYRIHTQQSWKFNLIRQLHASQARERTVVAAWIHFKNRQHTENALSRTGLAHIKSCSHFVTTAFEICKRDLSV